MKIQLLEGIRIFSHRFKKIKRYEGNASKICRQIIDDCWNGTYFMTSAGHFSEFFIRDFTWCIKPLINLGYKTKVEKTLTYALSMYKEHNKVTQIISAKGTPFDFPTIAVDSLPYLIRCLRILNNKKLIKKYNSFLNSEIDKFKNFIDESGFIKDKHYSSIKDHYKRKSSCYDNTMAAMLSMDAKYLGLSKFSYNKKNIMSFWNGNHFIDEKSNPIISGDANVFAYWSGVIKDKKMLNSSMKCIQKAGLDNPFPLKYTQKDKGKTHIKLLSITTKDYENDSIWMHLGPLYIELVKQIDNNLAKEYIDQYIRLIEKHKNYLEVFDHNEDPYKTLFYKTDHSMLWCSIFMTLHNQ